MQLMCEIDTACAMRMEGETVVGYNQVEMFDGEQLLQGAMVLNHPMQQVGQLAEESWYLRIGSGVVQPQRGERDMPQLRIAFAQKEEAVAIARQDYLVVLTEVVVDYRDATGGVS